MRSRPPSALSTVAQIAIVLVVFAIATVVLLGSTLFARHAASAIALPTATPEPIPSGYFKPSDDQWQSLTVVPVRTMSFGDVSDTDGTIAPADDLTTQIFSPFTGRVTAVYVTVGDHVRSGTPLFAGEGGEGAQALNDLATAQRTLDAAQVQLHVTEANRRRLLALGRVDGAARKDIEQSKADLATAYAAVKNDELAIALVRSRLRVLGEAAPAHAASASSAAPPPTNVIVRAPIDGVVMQRAVGVGQYLDSTANGASNALLTISGLSHVFLVANVTETQIARVHVGDPVAVTMLAFPGRVFDARVAFVAPMVDPTTHRIAVRAEVDNPDGSLRPGMFGSFSIATGAPTNAVGVPEDAVIFEGDSARVWVTGPNHSLALRYFTAGKTVNGMVEALRGLKSGDRVVTRGSVFIDRAAQGDD
jgi:cobalt-zinc-cadmium efflux system membrane fusion protein